MLSTPSCARHWSCKQSRPCLCPSTPARRGRRSLSRRTCAARTSRSRRRRDVPCPVWSRQGACLPALALPSAHLRPLVFRVCRGVPVTPSLAQWSLDLFCPFDAFIFSLRRWYTRPSSRCLTMQAVAILLRPAASTARATRQADCSSTRRSVSGRSPLRARRSRLLADSVPGGISCPRTTHSAPRA
jgi:hypothetical protein